MIHVWLFLWISEQFSPIVLYFPGFFKGKRKRKGQKQCRKEGETNIEWDVWMKHLTLLKEQFNLWFVKYRSVHISAIQHNK